MLCILDVEPLTHPHTLPNLVRIPRMASYYMYGFPSRAWLIKARVAPHQLLDVLGTPSSLPQSFARLPAPASSYAAHPPVQLPTHMLTDHLPPALDHLELLLCLVPKLVPIASCATTFTQRSCGEAPNVSALRSRLRAV